MVRINIDGQDKALDQVTPSWIKDQIERRRASGAPVCVLVTLKSADAEVVFQSGGCPHGLGGSRLPNPKEKHLLELWARLGLNQVNFQIDRLIRFLGDIKG